MEKQYKFCQSCELPFTKDPEGGGTEKDGSKNQKYCSLCYKNGNFLSPEIDTPEKMQTFCIETMKKNGMPGFVA